ncbi:MAG: hypothetical protein M3R13_04885 [Armatimonadota bacterium]|nr:hypothetical protein [Armatimonadota bacterium]
MLDIHPAGYETSVAYCAFGGVQGGWAKLNGYARAGIWTGTSASWIDLHPAKATESTIQDMHDGWAAGYTGEYDVSSRAHAWFGTTQQLDLHPVSAETSVADATFAGRHGGSYNAGSGNRACIFDVDPKSITTVHPPQALQSAIRGMYEEVQVGWVELEPNRRRAAMWSGSAASWIDLHPGPFQETSVAYSAIDGIQVGKYRDQAAVWNGSAQSHEGLHGFLDPSYVKSDAWTVSRQGDRMIVGGDAWTSSNILEPFLWISRYESPESLSLFRGTLVSGGLSELAESDDTKLIVRPGIVFSTTEPPVQVVIEGTASDQNPDSLGFSLEASVSFGVGDQAIQLYNFDSDRYETVDLRGTTTLDRVTNVSIRSDAQRFVEFGTNKMRARVTFKPTAPMFSYPWQARIDLARFRLPG